MTADKRIEEIIRAISAKDTGAASTYHALSGEARQKVLDSTERRRAKDTHRLIKEAKKKTLCRSKQTVS